MYDKKRRRKKPLSAVDWQFFLLPFERKKNKWNFVAISFQVRKEFWIS